MPSGSAWSVLPANTWTMAFWWSGSTFWVRACVIEVETRKPVRWRRYSAGPPWSLNGSFVGKNQFPLYPTDGWVHVDILSPLATRYRSSFLSW